MRPGPVWLLLIPRGRLENRYYYIGCVSPIRSSVRVDTSNKYLADIEKREGKHIKTTPLFFCHGLNSNPLRQYKQSTSMWVRVRVSSGSPSIEISGLTVSRVKRRLLEWMCLESTKTEENRGSLKVDFHNFQPSHQGRIEPCFYRRDDIIGSWGLEQANKKEKYIIREQYSERGNRNNIFTYLI